MFQFSFVFQFGKNFSFELSETALKICEAPEKVSRTVRESLSSLFVEAEVVKGSEQKFLSVFQFITKK